MNIKKEQRRILSIIRRHHRKLKKIPGVTDVAVGWEISNGESTGELAIRVSVNQKVPETSLSTEEIIPSEIEGVPVDVVTSNRALQANRNREFDPLLGGIATTSVALWNYVGTLGAVFYDSDNGKPRGLSNHHVWLGQIGRIGDYVFQPAGQPTGPVIGKILRGDSGLDCAVCDFDNSRGITNDILDIPFQIQGFEDPFIDVPVIKSGRTTGLTRGIIDAVSLDDFTIKPDSRYPVPEISAGGDSGSIWLNESTKKAIGLHFAGEKDPTDLPDVAYAKKIKLVVRAMKLTHKPPAA